MDWGGRKNVGVEETRRPYGPRGLKERRGTSEEESTDTDEEEKRDRRITTGRSRI